VKHKDFIFHLVCVNEVMPAILAGSYGLFIRRDL
jgi:hypothetical protein